ncbi:hypothetical protein D3C87_1546790 [compost metagenome]
MEAIHGQDGGRFASRPQGLKKSIRKRGFAGPRGTGNGYDETGLTLCPPKNVFDDRLKLQRHAASVSFGASLAPVMKATASDME